MYLIFFLCLLFLLPIFAYNLLFSQKHPHRKYITAGVENQQLFAKKEGHPLCLLQQIHYSQLQMFYSSKPSPYYPKEP